MACKITYEPAGLYAQFSGTVTPEDLADLSDAMQSPQCAGCRYRIADYKDATIVLKQVDMRYPLLEQDSRCALILVEAAHGGRWKASVTLERDDDFVRLKAHPAPSKVPNDFPTQEAAAEAAYAFARLLISRQGVAIT